MNVYIVYVGIGSDYYVIVMKIVNVVFDVEGVLEEVEFFIFIYDFFG